MSPSDSSTLTSSSVKPDLDLPKRIIETDTLNFREKFNRSPFMFSHNLAGHRFFEIPRLVELSNFILNEAGTEKVTCLVGGDIPIGCKWSEQSPKEQVAEAISHIQESGSWVLIRDIQLDPEYNALLEQILDELEKLTGVPLRQEISWLGGLIFIASPHSVTSYHIDHESNFLFQIHGEKDNNLFNPSDRSVLTDQELEAFYTGNIEAANYKEENQSKANVYHLTPGKGVHQPVNAPHWVRNGSSFSVTLSVLFYMRSFDLQARVYQANYYLRKLRLKPTPPGKAALLDSIKIFAIGLFSKRKPESKYEIFNSGIKRITAPIRFAARMARKLK